MEDLPLIVLVRSFDDTGALELRHDGAEAPSQLTSPKNTVYLMPNVRYRLLVRFEDCHTLLHKDEGMMGLFVVIEPGQEDEVRVGAAARHGP